MSETALKTRRIKLPFESINKKPYIFASYGHDDKEIVFPLLKQLYEDGYNVWYDEGITIGEKYDEVIENHIRDSAVFILFASSLSLSRPYIKDVELKIANDNLDNVPVLTLFIENGLSVPDDIEGLLPQQRFNDISQVIEHLKSINLQNSGKRTAVPIEREVPQYWFDGHDIDPAGGTKNAVYSEEAPYACIAFHPDDLIFCNPYIKEMYFAGYNVRSCENCNGQERAEMIKSSECMAYVPVVTKKYVESGQLEQDYDIAKNSGKHLIALYIPTYDKEGKEEKFVLPSSISKEFSSIQGLSLSELTNNDFLSKLEMELEKSKCYASEKDGKVERRSFEIKDFLYDFTEDRKGIVLTKFGGDNASVVIKTAYGGFPVREIEDSAFSGCSITDIIIPDSVTSIGYKAFSRSDLTDITIPDSVTSIGDYAFLGCRSLTGINISNSVTSIGEGAFRDCSSLTCITIPECVTSIGDYAFYDCSSLTGITISDSVTTIGHDAFSRCSNLTDITIPDSVTSIGNYAFSNCYCLTAIIIPDSVTSISHCAFLGCRSLTDITIPDSVTSISYEAFEGCRSLTNITIPDSVTSIGDKAFENCSNLTAITIPDNVTSIGHGTFSGCSSLTAITMPDNATSIGARAFFGCSSLTAITMPDNVTSIGEWAFGCCSSLTGISVNADNRKYCDIDGVLLSKDKTLLIAYPNAHGGKYSIPDSVTSIGYYAFSDCSSLTAITIPDSVTSINYYAFSGCTSLTTITIPDSVTSIGDSAFSDCSSLTDITIPDSVTSIGREAFSGCSRLNAITIPDSVTSIGYEAFSGCGCLTVYCSENSRAWRYCEENRIKHNPLSKAPAKFSSAPRKTSPARWLVPLLILLALAAAGLQLLGFVDILGLLGL